MPVRMTRKVFAVVAMMAATLCLASPAYADLRAGASQDAYGGQGAVLSDQNSGEPAVQSEQGGVGAPASAVAPTSAVLDSRDSAALPFTGLDVLALVGGGLVLVLVGMTVRQVTRRPA